ncbi:MAG: hypothetical protein ACXW3C_14925, partial [Pyrinomonadaceae bacterium]
MLSNIKAKVILAAAAFTLVQSASAQTAPGTKVYRGSVGPSHIQMTLSFNGSNVTGKYSYDSVGEDIKVTGRLDANGNLELTEFGQKNKPTGKFSCKRPLDDPSEQECYWA